MENKKGKMELTGRIQKTHIVLFINGLTEVHKSFMKQTEQQQQKKTNKKNSFFFPIETEVGEDMLE